MPTLISEDKFETGGTWDTSAGTPTIVTTPVPVSSTRALECNAIGDYVFWNIPNSGYTRCVMGAWVYLVAAPPSLVTRIMKVDSGPSEGWLKFGTPLARPEIASDGTPTIGPVTFATDYPTATWQWCQVMYDVSANPWEIRGKIAADPVVSNTGAAAASTLDPGIFLLGNTAGGNTLTVYFGHIKMGVAADDDDWWPEPSSGSSLSLLGVG